MRIEVVTIGDELLLGYTLDTNAAHLARELAAIGVEIVRRTTCGDTAESIATAVREALDRTGAVITTGGLGPTSDDLTKPSIASLFGRRLVLDEAHLSWMRDRWAKRWPERPMPDANVQQAMLPEGARKLTNHHGSAPGIWLEDERGRWVAMLPGVPREMRGMLADTLLPLVRERLGEVTAVVRSRTLRTTGIAESLVADRIASLGGIGDVELAYLPGVDGVDLRLTVRNVGPDDADARLELAATRIRTVMRDAIYGENDSDLAAVVLAACRARHVTLGLAESCTGGMLGARLTAVPGSSDVVYGGVIAYHDSLKRSLLGVPEELLREHGAVSEPVVRAMASGVRAVAKVDAALAITGVAGPGGGTVAKPVGTVWIAMDFKGEVESRLLNLWGDRDEVRRRAAQAAMELLRRKLLGHAA
jgi:nicotinamide-nucleotide amidase